MSNLVFSGCTSISNTAGTNSWGLIGSSTSGTAIVSGSPNVLYGTSFSNCTINGTVALGSTGMLNDDLYNDICDVQLSDGYSYKAIDDIFESATGRFYMQVMINYNYMNVSLDKINEITDSKNNLNGYKKKLIRNKKLKRIL